MASLTETIKFIESVFGRANLARDEKNVSVRCPICDPRDPTKKKLVIRTSDHITHCWVCGWSSRTLVPLLKKFAGREQLNTYVNSLSPIKVKPALLEDAPEEKRLEIPTDVRLLASLKEHTPDELAVLRYATQRNMTESDLWYYRIVVSAEQRWNRRIMFISHDSQGSPNYLTGRSIDPKRNPKYLNSVVERNSVIFNELNIEWGKPLTLCEGPFDLIRCGDNATCLLGSEISESSLLFDRIITNSTPVILALDADTYLKKRPRVIKKFQEYDVDVRLVNLGGYPDPGSAPKDFMLQQIKDATPVDWERMFFDKLINF